MDTFSFIVAGIMVYIAVAVFIGGMIYQITGHVQLVVLEQKVFLLYKPKIHDHNLSFDL